MKGWWWRRGEEEEEDGGNLAEEEMEKERTAEKEEEEKKKKRGGRDSVQPAPWLGCTKSSEIHQIMYSTVSSRMARTRIKDCSMMLHSI